MEGFNSSPAFNGLTVANCRTDSTGWDGIQLSIAHNFAVYDDTARYTGLGGISSQQTGILLGGNSWGYATRNYIYHAASSGYQVFGDDSVNISNSIIDSSGWTSADPGLPTPNQQAAVYVHNNILSAVGGALSPAQGPGLKLVFENNCIKYPSN
jgi:hypothetical protein